MPFDYVDKSGSNMVSQVHRSLQNFVLTSRPRSGCCDEGETWTCNGGAGVRSSTASSEQVEIEFSEAPSMPNSLDDPLKAKEQMPVKLVSTDHPVVDS